MRMVSGSGSSDFMLPSRLTRRCCLETKPGLLLGRMNSAKPWTLVLQSFEIMKHLLVHHNVFIYSPK